MPINPLIPMMGTPGSNTIRTHNAIQNHKTAENNNKLLELDLQYAQEDRPMQQQANQQAMDDEEDRRQANEARRLLKIGNTEGAAELLRKDGPEDVLGNSLADGLDAGDVDTVAQVLDDMSGLFEKQGQGSIPASIQEYLFRSQNLGIGTEADRAFMAGKRADQIFNVGGVPHVNIGNGTAVPVNTPEGMATLGREVAGAAAIAGGKEAAVQGAQIDAAVPKAVATAEGERQAGAPEAIQGAEAQISAIDSTMDEVADAIGLVGPSTAGYGAFLRFLPATDARQLRTKIDTIKANLAFDKLQNMRNLSKTGGALGQVSERELNLLESAVASLDQGLEDDALRANLQKIVRHYSNAKYVLKKIVDVNQGRISEQDAMRDIDQIELNRVGGPPDPELPEDGAKVIRYDAEGNRLP